MGSLSLFNTKRLFRLNFGRKTRECDDNNSKREVTESLVPQSPRYIFFFFFSFKEKSYFDESADMKGGRVHPSVCVMFLIYPQTRRVWAQSGDSARWESPFPSSRVHFHKGRQDEKAESDWYTHAWHLYAQCFSTDKQTQRSQTRTQGPEWEREKRGEGGLTRHQKWANMFNHHATLFFRRDIEKNVKTQDEEEKWSPHRNGQVNTAGKGRQVKRWSRTKNLLRTLRTMASWPSCCCKTSPDGDGDRCWRSRERKRELLSQCSRYRIGETGWNSFQLTCIAEIRCYPYRIRQYSDWKTESRCFEYK